MFIYVFSFCYMQTFAIRLELSTQLKIQVLTNLYQPNRMKIALAIL